MEQRNHEQTQQQDEAALALTIRAEQTMPEGAVAVLNPLTAAISPADAPWLTGVANLESAELPNGELKILAKEVVDRQRSQTAHLTPDMQDYLATDGAVYAQHHMRQNPDTGEVFFVNHQTGEVQKLRKAMPHELILQQKRPPRAKERLAALKQSGQVEKKEVAVAYAAPLPRPFTPIVEESAENKSCLPPEDEQGIAEALADEVPVPEEDEPAAPPPPKPLSKAELAAKARREAAEARRKKEEEQRLAEEAEERRKQEELEREVELQKQKNRAMKNLKAKAKAALREGRFQEANDLFTELLTYDNLSDKERASSHSDRSSARSQLRQMEGAVEDAEEAERLVPGAGIRRLHMAKIHIGHIEHEQDEARRAAEAAAEEEARIAELERKATSGG